MGRRLWRLLVAGVAAGVLVAACGGEGGEAFTTTTAGPVGTVGETTTTAAWGEEMAPGVGALVEGSRVLLREDFQDGDTAGWVVEAGWYLLENGERRMAAAGGEAWAWFQGGLGWSRYGARLVLMVNAGSLGVSVAVGEGGRYVVQFSEEGVHLLKDAPFGSTQALGSSQPVSLGEPHVLAVGSDGGHLQVYVDGVLLVDATDRSPLPGGSLGLGAADGSSVVVDNIVVASLGGPLPGVLAVAELADEPLPDPLADAAPQAGEQLEAEEPIDTGLPNLVVTGVSYPMQIHLGEEFEVAISARNVGLAGAGPFAVSFTSGGTQCQARVAGMEAGEEASTSCQFEGYANGADSYEWVAAVDSGEDIDEGGLEPDNLAAGTIWLAQEETEETQPNVVIGWAERMPVDPAPDDAIIISFGVTQTNPDWTGLLPDLEFRAFYEGGNTACRTTVPSGQSEGACEVPAFGQPGEYPLQLVIDAAGVLAESNEEDNAVFRSIRVSEPGAALPNLVLESVTQTPSPPTTGDEVRLEMVFVLYDELASASSYTIRFVLDGVLICSIDNPFVGGRIGEGCLAGDLAAGSHEWMVVLDADNDIAESNEDDNAAVGRFTVQG